MPFTNEIAGGQGSLVRNWLQSQNFVTGVSGWQIRKDGNVEFNNGTFRGSITSGTNPGQHIVLNNGLTGDAIDVYDSSNRLVAFIDNNGVIGTILQPSQDEAALRGNSLGFGRLNDPPFLGAGMAGIASKTIGCQTNINSGQATNTTNQSSLTLWDSKRQAQDIIWASQRAITGLLVQTDATSPIQNNLIHMSQYGVTYAAAGNAQVFNHGCAFTPAGCIVSFDDGSATNSATVSVSTGLITATQATLYTVYEPGGGTPGAGDLVLIQALFYA